MQTPPHDQRHTLWLAPHVCACETDGQVILLDLRSGTYLGVRQRRALGDAIGGWPGAPVTVDDTGPGCDIADFVRPLLSRGLLTQCPLNRPVSSAVASPVRSLNADDAIDPARIGPMHLCRFLAAVAITSVRLRHRSLLSIAATAATRRAKHAAAASAAAADDPPHRLAVTVARYEALRPFVFTARDRCLFDSLALLQVLAGEALFPRWVIGVKTRPFAAHSWLQWGDTVLNDQHDHVRPFRPILVV